MKNKVIAELYQKLRKELNKLPDSEYKDSALLKLQYSEQSADRADADARHNPPGKTVVRNSKGEVKGLQG